MVRPSVNNRIAVGGTPRSSPRTSRTPWPNRLCSPFGSTSSNFFKVGSTWSGAVDFGERPGRRRNEVKLDFMILLQFLEQFRLVSTEPTLGNRQAGRLGLSGGLGQAVGRGFELGVGVLVGNAEARRIVDHDDEVRQTGPLDRQDRLGEHENRHDDEGDAQAREHHPIPSRRGHLAAIEPNDERARGE